MYQQAVTVRTMVNDFQIPTIGGVVASWEGSHMPALEELKKKGSKYSVIDPKGEAEISVGLEEKVSGPERTYSSVTVFVRVTLRCKQQADQIKQATVLAHSECVTAIESYIEPAYQLLLSHLGERNG